MNIYLNILMTIYGIALIGTFCTHESKKMRFIDVLATLTLIGLTLGAAGVFG